ncbi:hypothetical protein EMCG_02126 [[Emmonsia] crescens]|uniref:Uncharacterized protein n=1 Tax=[Emmonsia] crescens TaxID=73230 RepID=A0A0G2J1W8_9EURO|nr:hypothetical protein EMCG_02126 [Emmonsia crescens UAMH 3008]
MVASIRSESFAVHPADNSTTPATSSSQPVGGILNKPTMTTVAYSDKNDETFIMMHYWEFVQFS